MTTRWRWPPDSSCGKRYAKSDAGRRPAASSAAKTARLALRAFGQAVDRERFGDEVEDGLLRIERLVGVLEDELDPPSILAAASRRPTGR